MTVKMINGKLTTEFQASCAPFAEQKKGRDIYISAFFLTIQSL